MNSQCAVPASQPVTGSVENSLETFPAEDEFKQTKDLDSQLEGHLPSPPILLPGCLCSSVFLLLQELGVHGCRVWLSQPGSCPSPPGAVPLAE